MTNKKTYKELLDEQDEELEKIPDMNEQTKYMRKHLKKLERSIGWVDFEQVKWSRPKSNIIKETDEYNVLCEDGGIYCADNQDTAEMMSYLTQIFFTLRRLEKRVIAMESRKNPQNIR